MRTISITNQKGGCGKTTTAINLASSLAYYRKRVLLVDFDPQAHASLGLGIKSDVSMYNVLSKFATERLNINEIIKKIEENFYLIPSNIILSTLEQELAGEISRESRLKNIFTELKDFDYVIIDCPPNLGLLTINAICSAEEIIIPVEASRFSVEGLNQLLDIINLVRERLDCNVDYKILVTIFDSRLRHSFEMLEKIKQTFRGKLFDTIIHINVSLKEAQNQGMHILNYDKYSRGAKDYLDLARELMWERGEEAIRLDLRKKMRELIERELPRIKEILFSIYAPEAKEVYLVGDFNDWQLHRESLMDKSEDGFWKKRLSLSKGVYRYRFVVDGVWKEDPQNQYYQINPFGEKDSLIEIIE
ncbi:MAG: AAA family ATPase [Candidatus Omnitrophica bacterium]|nr:AAA family ATPase [Candidatus Omnitrophota bacterium]